MKIEEILWHFNIIEVQSIRNRTRNTWTRTRFTSKCPFSAMRMRCRFVGYFHRKIMRIHNISRASYVAATFATTNNCDFILTKDSVYSINLSDANCKIVKVQSIYHAFLENVRWQKSRKILIKGNEIEEDSLVGWNYIFRWGSLRLNRSGKGDGIV